VRRRALTCCLLLAATGWSGCATITSQCEFWQGDMRESERYVPGIWKGIHIYRGTGVCLGTWGMLLGLKDLETDGCAIDFGPVVYPLDLPFSFVADTVLLPLTICQQLGVFGTPRGQDAGPSG